MPAIEIAAACVLAICCLAAVWSDVKKRRIPNALCLLTALAGLAASALLGGSAGLIGGLSHALIALAIGMGLFALKIVGGGDAKFYSGVAAWIALNQAVALVIAVSLAGFAAFMVWFTYRRLRGEPVSRLRAGKSASFPYAIAIALGTFMVYPAMLPAMMA